MSYRLLIRTASLLSFILIFTISTFVTAPVPLSNAQGGYSYTFGGGGGGIPAGYTVLLDVISLTGEILFDTTALSFDGLCELTIDKNTIALNALGYPLFSILIVAAKSPPPPPVNGKIVGIVYDFRPSGATFDPAITGTFTYDSDNLPEGIDEANLYIAFYDTMMDSWVALDSAVVDLENNTISGKLSHFAAFAIIAYTAPELEPISTPVPEPEPPPTTEPESVPTTKPEPEPEPAHTPKQPEPESRSEPTPTSILPIPESEPESTPASTPATAEPEPETNWWIIGIIITIIIIFSAVTWMVIQHRRI